MTSSRSDFRSDVVRWPTGAGSLSLLATITLLLAFEFLDDRVQRVEARGPQLAVVLDPGGLFLEPARAEPAAPHASHLFGGDELRMLENADVLPHAGQGHVEPLRED